MCDQARNRSFIMRLIAHGTAPDKATCHRRRAKQRSAGEQWAPLKERYNYTCLCCGRREPDIKLTPDHVIPLDDPGTGYISNIQPLCLSGNSTKGTRTIDYRPLWDDEPE
jgi:5-methylcytosine-specific restriction endonuclease McrA